MKKTGAKRIFFLGKVKVNGPLHIGLGAQTPGIGYHETDQPVLLDHEGRPFIPATSLGGLMRSIAENLVSVLDKWSLQDLVNLFGAARVEKEKEGEKEGKLKFSVSKLRIRNARLVGNWRGWTEIRDSVGIDRRRGAARAGIKFDYEIVSPCLEFDFWAELRDGSEREKILLTLVLVALEKLSLSVGAKGGSGFGTLQLKVDKIVELDLHNKEQLLGFLLERDEFIRKQKGKNWVDWQREVLKGHSFRLRETENERYFRIPQVFVFTYRLTVEDPLLVANQRVDPLIAFEAFAERHGADLRQREKQGIDAVWIGTGSDFEMKDWQPIIPGPSVRGVFRSHCERILRTLAWHYSGEIRNEYKMHCPAAVDLWEVDEQMQNQIKEKWEQIMRGEGTEEEKWHKAGKEIANLVWQESDLAEKMFGSTFWKSLVTVSEAYIPEDEAREWHDLLFDHLAVERFSGGAMEGKKFDALPITQATFEGKIAVWGDEPFMLGLVSLFFKDLCDGLVRFGSSKTRGYGKLLGKLKKVEAFLLHGTNLAKQLGIQQEAGKVWHYKCWELPDRKFPECLQDEGLTDLRNLLCEGVRKLNELVKNFRRRGKEGGGEG